MKFIMDETMKHRMVGIAVIISIALVFVPAMIKKNNQRLEEKKIAVELPAKPPQPEVAEVDGPKVFAETKVAHIDLDTQNTLSQTKEAVNRHAVSAPKSIQQSLQVAYPIGKAETASHIDSKIVPVKERHPQQPESRTVEKPVKSPLISAKKKVPKIQKKAKVHTHIFPKYAVQVGAFSEAANAQVLQRQLSQKGYQSRLVKTTVHGKPAIKVLIGQLKSAEAANRLKVKLVKEQKIQGFVTNGIG